MLKRPGGPTPRSPSPRAHDARHVPAMAGVEGGPFRGPTPTMRPRTQRSKSFLIAHTVAARPARAIDRVNGMLFGHTATQFWALPHI